MHRRDNPWLRSMCLETALNRAANSSTAAIYIKRKKKESQNKTDQKHGKKNHGFLKFCTNTNVMYTPQYRVGDPFIFELKIYHKRNKIFGFIARG